MNREIKFRGIRLDNGEWVYGDLLHLVDGVYISNDNGNNMEQVNPDTVGMSTGLKDKSGKEIYEGDVLRSDKYPYRSRDKECDNYFGLIEWNKNEAAFYIVTIKNPKCSIKGIFDGTSDYISQSALQDFEVIGNIYDDEWKQFREHL